MNALSTVTARPAGIELTWARLSLAARIFCPAVFSSQVPGRKKTGGREGRSRFLKKKPPGSAEVRPKLSQVRVVSPAERSVGFPKA